MTSLTPTVDEALVPLLTFLEEDDPNPFSERRPAEVIRGRRYTEARVDILTSTLNALAPLDAELWQGVLTIRDGLLHERLSKRSQWDRYWGLLTTYYHQMADDMKRPTDQKRAYLKSVLREPGRRSTLMNSLRTFQRDWGQDGPQLAQNPYEDLYSPAYSDTESEESENESMDTEAIHL